MSSLLNYTQVSRFRQEGLRPKFPQIMSDVTMLAMCMWWMFMLGLCRGKRSFLFSGNRKEEMRMLQRLSSKSNLSISLSTRTSRRSPSCVLLLVNTVSNIQKPGGATVCTQCLPPYPLLSIENVFIHLHFPPVWFCQLPIDLNPELTRVKFYF